MKISTCFLKKNLLAFSKLTSAKIDQTKSHISDPDHKSYNAKVPFIMIQLIYTKKGT